MKNKTKKIINSKLDEIIFKLDDIESKTYSQFDNAEYLRKRYFNYKYCIVLVYQLLLATTLLIGAILYSLS